MSASESTSLLQGDDQRNNSSYNDEQHAVVPVMGTKPAPWSKDYFGPKPPHPHLTQEETASIPSRLDYSWIGNRINKAKDGELPVGGGKQAMPVSEEDKAWTVATALYHFYGLQRAAAASWDSEVNSSSSRFRLKSDCTSRGVLRYIGKVQKGGGPEIPEEVSYATKKQLEEVGSKKKKAKEPQDDPKMYVVVEWTSLPKNYIRAINKPSDNKNGPRWVRKGMFKGEKLFTPSAGGNDTHATLEDPDELQFVRNAEAQKKISAAGSGGDGGCGDRALATASQPPKTPSLIKALFQTVKAPMLTSVIPRFTYECCYLVAPIILQQYVDFLENPDRQWEHGVLLTGIFFFINIGQSLSFQKHFHICMRAGLNLRSALMAQIVHKAITVGKKPVTHPDLSSGKIINMMSADVEHVNTTMGFVNYVWSSPLQIVVAVSLLYRMVGWIAFASVAVTILVIPLQALVMKRQVGARTDFSAATDRRVKATNELFNSIYVVKSMGWEESFRQNVLKLRDQELYQLRRIQIFRVANAFMTAASPMLVMATVFTLFHVTGKVLTPRIVFPVIALLNILQMPFMVIPMLLNFGTMALVAIRRLNSFLSADDNDDVVKALNLPEIDDVHKGRDEDKEKDTFDVHWNNVSIAAYTSVEIKDPKPHNKQHRKGSTSPQAEKEGEDPLAQEEEEDEQNPGKKFFSVHEKRLLHDITVKIPRKKFTVIVGATGSGKTTLLESLLGELKVQTGGIESNKSLAFVPQQAWVMNATVRDNITFFSDLDQKRFDQTVDTCQLAVDLTQFANGADTEIGEKGVSLSGGQKARINLARAVYANREVYLLDDPLAAVDTHVSKKLVEQCLQCTLAHTTRILVTHQTHVISHADHVILLDKGRVAYQGCPNGYRQYQLDRGAAGAGDIEETDESGDHGIKGGCSAGPTPAAGDGKKGEEVFDAAEKKGDGGDEDKKGGDKKEKAGGMSTEEKAEGAVGLAMYKRYLQACGGTCKYILLMMWYTLTECVNASSNLWLSFWSVGTFGLSQSTYLYVYLCIIALAAGNSASRAYLVYGFGRRGSKALHAGILASVSAAPMSFYDTTPIGRILNRFAKDMDSIDNELPMNFLSMMNTGFSIMSSSTIMLVSQPFVIVPMIPAFFVYSKIMSFFNAANREVKRVDNINKSPVFAILTEVLGGSKSITAFHKASPVMQEVLRRIDCCFSSSYLQQICNRWLGFRLEFLGNVLITAIAGLGVLTTATNIPPLQVGLISLGMTLAMSITQQMNWLVRGTAAVEAGMNSVERLLHYTTDIDNEDFGWYDKSATETRENGSRKNPIPQITMPHHLRKQNGEAAPSTGGGRGGSATQLDIEFKDVHLRYRQGLPLVLKGASFQIPPRSKVGFVGRSGSGKSTTLQAFLRIVDICGGEILIGGVPIKHFALDHLRSLFALIPQDPVLFAGTVKSNLDPFHEHDDKAILSAIEQVGLLERVMKGDGEDDEAEAEVVGGTPALGKNKKSFASAGTFKKAASAKALKKTAAAAAAPEDDDDDKKVGVQCPVVAGGTNFSVGQRQLMCMARALLKKDTGFILLDEATANIDPTSDQLIQKTIRTAFKSYTVITIAHRLETVIDSDLIVVMDAGRTAEVGSPAELLDEEASAPTTDANEETSGRGIFKGMVEALSPEQQMKLKEAATAAAAASKSSNRREE